MKGFNVGAFENRFIEKRNRTVSEDLMHLVLMYKLEGEVRRFAVKEEVMNQKELAVATLREVCEAVANRYCYFDDRNGCLLFLERNKSFSCAELLEPGRLEFSEREE